MRRIGKFLGLAAAAALAPACGSGEGGLPVASTPTAIVSTPAGVQTFVVAVGFLLTDAESDPADVAVSYSTDGGATWLPATADFSNGPLTGLSTSPFGAAHVFLWDSSGDGVAAGTVAYGGPITSHGTVNPQVRVRVAPTGGTAGATSNFTVDNTMQRRNGTVTGLFPHSYAALGTSETASGDLVTDAMRARYGTQLAFQNGWGITRSLPSSTWLPTDTTLRRPEPGYAAGPPYDLTLGDFYEMLGYPNRVVTRTVTGAQLHAALEHGVSSYPANHNGFPQISGFSFSFKASNPAGSRVLSVTLAGGGPILADATVYTFATNDFVNAGGDGYGMLNDGQGTAWESYARVVADYVLTAGPFAPTIAGRITVVP
jgi:hypothetical protein